MLIGYLFKPLPNVSSIQFVLALIGLLFFKRRWLVQNYLALLCTAMHAYCTLSAGANVLNILDNLLEFPTTDTML